jgi:hypothetical protein
MGFLRLDYLFLYEHDSSKKNAPENQDSQERFV